MLLKDYIKSINMFVTITFVVLAFKNLSYLKCMTHDC